MSDPNVAESAVAPNPTAGVVGSDASTKASGVGTPPEPPVPVVVPPSPAEGAGGSVKTPAASPASAPVEKSTSTGEDWTIKRIGQLTAKLNEAKAQLAAARESQKPQGEPNSGAEFEAAVKAEARRIAEIEAFNAKANETARIGRSAFVDFDDKVQGLGRLVNVQDAAEIARYNEMVATAMETGKGHEVIYALGKDLNLAKRLMEFSSTKMAIEIAGIANKIGTKAVLEVSEAPKPLTPVNGINAALATIDPGDSRSDQLSVKDWIQRREEQVRQKHAAGRV